MCETLCLRALLASYCSRRQKLKRNLTNKTRKDTQFKFYKVMAVPVLLYGCETSAPNRSDKRKMETAEMRLLIHDAGYTRRDEISNLTIRSEL